MTRAANEFERADHYRDRIKHDRSLAEIDAELARIEREMREAAAKGQIACKEAMATIETLMADLGIPMHKGPSDAS